MDTVKHCLHTDGAHPAVGGAGVDAFIMVAQQDWCLAAFAEGPVGEVVHLHPFRLTFR